MKLAPVLVAMALTLPAQPRILNAKLETRALAGSLDAELQRIRSAAGSQPVWVGWAVPSAIRGQQSCCWYSDNESSWRGCALEPNQKERPAASSAPISLEPPRDVHILLRFEKDQPDKLRSFSADCELDAVETQVVWLTGVKPADSVNVLATYLGGREESVTRRALGIIAVHADSSAEGHLMQFVNDKENHRLRAWAMGPLARRGGPNALGILQSAIASDPDVNVKRHAVDALTQLPRNEGIPTLIQLAKTGATPDLRKRAMQRVGRSTDPRAVAFVNEVLR